MTGLHYLHAHVLPVAFQFLPLEFDRPAARAMLLAIAGQESRCCHRRQVRGPARGFWQFEKGGGVKGVLKHPATKDLAAVALRRLQYPDLSVETAYTAIEHHDPLAAIFARLLLYTLPDPLPTRDRASEGWRQYLAAWRPGTPHPDTWADHYAAAWTLVG